MVIVRAPLPGPGPESVQTKPVGGWWRGPGWWGQLLPAAGGEGVYTCKGPNQIIPHTCEGVARLVVGNLLKYSLRVKFWVCIVKSTNGVWVLSLNAGLRQADAFF